eukprot:scaffold220121_cov21-Tisochrysis_lutea.AAC.1
MKKLCQSGSRGCASVCQKAVPHWMQAKTVCYWPQSHSSEKVRSSSPQTRRSKAREKSERDLPTHCLFRQHGAESIKGKKESLPAKRPHAPRKAMKEYAGSHTSLAFLFQPDDA